MDKKLKKQWVDALRSGDYVQGKGRLCMLDDKGNARYCCLGVLREEIDGEGVWMQMNTYGNLISHVDSSMSYMNKHPPGLELRHTNKLMTMNDDGVSFEDIADWIEGNIPGE